MEIWHIVVICILMLPLFLLANYIVVKKAATQRRLREERVDRAVAASVAESYADKSKRFQSWPQYRPARKKGKN